MPILHKQTFTKMVHNSIIITDNKDKYYDPEILQHCQKCSNIIPVELDNCTKSIFKSSTLQCPTAINLKNFYYDYIIKNDQLILVANRTVSIRQRCLNDEKNFNITSPLYYLSLDRYCTYYINGGEVKRPIVKKKVMNYATFHEVKTSMHSIQLKDVNIKFHVPINIPNTPLNVQDIVFIDDKLNFSGVKILAHPFVIGPGIIIMLIITVTFICLYCKNQRFYEIINSCCIKVIPTTTKKSFASLAYDFNQTLNKPLTNEWQIVTVLKTHQLLLAKQINNTIGYYNYLEENITSINELPTDDFSPPSQILKDKYAKQLSQIPIHTLTVDKCGFTYIKETNIYYSNMRWYINKKPVLGLPLLDQISEPNTSQIETSTV